MTTDKNRIKSFAHKIACDGFVREEVRGGYATIDGSESYSNADADALAVRLTSASGNEMLIFRLSCDDVHAAGKKIGRTVVVDGTTAFRNAAGRWLSFDRRGIDSSFYIGPYSDVNAETFACAPFVATEMERIAKARDADARALTVPQLGFRISPERREELRAALLAGRSARLTPSGMGTGKKLTITRPRGRFGITHLPGVAKFFDVADCYSEDFDYD